MTCRTVRKRLSAYRDDELGRGQASSVAAHLERCAPCAARWRSLNAALDRLAGAPRVVCSEPIAPAVRERLELEARSPGLGLVFRSFWAARPLILPSLVPATLVLVAVLSSALALDRYLTEDPLPEVFAASAEVSIPRLRADGLFPADLLAAMGEGSLFLETVVARDGSVSAVTLLAGDSEQARPLLDALRRERFEPARFRGRPVAASVYRLISRMDVRVPVT